MPIRGHSGVQGGAEMGCYATAFPGGAAVDAGERRRRSARSGASRSPASPAWSAPEMIDAAGRGELDLLFASGGNFLDVLPDPDSVERTLGRIPLRVHMDLVPSSQMLVDPPEGGAVLILPATTRYEVRGRGHRDDDRAPRRPQPRDRGPADRRGAPGVAGVRRARRARPARARRAGPLRRHAEIRARSPRSSRSTAGSRTSARAATRSSTAGRTPRRDATSRPPTAGRTSPR